MNRVIRTCGEQRHDGIAHVLVNDAVVPNKHRFHPPEVRVDEVEVLGRTHPLGKRGEVPDIREENGHRPFNVVSRTDIGNAALAQQPEGLGGKETADSFLHLALQNIPPCAAFPARQFRDRFPFRHAQSLLRCLRATAHRSATTRQMAQEERRNTGPGTSATNNRVAAHPSRKNIREFQNWTS
ncbi:MAG: hypothetical protein BWY06_03342 [Candidatus Latescibacteria bacterium ADurb.Bin168]|nr:MAG: hypothetical protein BWY06_03342 [Candidatus Latescibacteria bacterium ADurb.Bin168]